MYRKKVYKKQKEGKIQAYIRGIIRVSKLASINNEALFEDLNVFHFGED